MKERGFNHRYIRTYETNNIGDKHWCRTPRHFDDKLQQSLQIELAKVTVTSRTYRKMIRLWFVMTFTVTRSTQIEWHLEMLPR